MKAILVSTLKSTSEVNFNVNFNMCEKHIPLCKLT